LRELAKDFVLLRLTRMREVNLAIFDFDYDLTWIGFFLNSSEKVYGRYGGRDAGSADGRVSLAGLASALEAALKEHRAAPSSKEQRSRPPERFTVADYSAFQRLPANACVHCHQVYDLRRESLQAAGNWSLDEVWVYPQPENVGLTLDIDRGNQVTRVTPGSPADKAGLRPGDTLLRVDERAVRTIADMQYALHRAGTTRTLPIRWQRDGKELAKTLDLPDGWRKTDVSWRWSLRGIDPVPPLRGDDLTSEEKAALGLGSNRLAFRQGPFVAAAAEQAGVRQNDVVIGVDGKELQMTARQFGAHIRLGYKVGDRVVFNLLRAGRRLNVSVTLTGR
jgi:serine protease Do